MRFKGIVTTLGIASAFSLSIFMTSCTSKITEEQMRQLSELRRQEASLNEQIGRARSDNTRLEGEVRSRRAEVDLCNQERQFVQSKLAQWPNIWPDYTPGEPQQTPAPVKK